MNHVHAQLPAVRHHAFQGGCMSHGPATPSPHEICELDIRELRFCHLRDPREIARVMHLRQEIQLPGATVSDPAFATREKKETRLALSGRLCGKASASAPSGLFPSNQA